jgi:hypothetical protein
MVSEGILYGVIAKTVKVHYETVKWVVKKYTPMLEDIANDEFDND